MALTVLTRCLSVLALLAVCLLGLRNAGAIALGPWADSITPSAVVAAIALGLIDRFRKNKPVEPAFPNWAALLVFGGALVILAADRFYRFSMQEIASAVGLALFAAGVLTAVAKAAFEFRRNRSIR